MRNGNRPLESLPRLAAKEASMPRDDAHPTRALERVLVATDLVSRTGGSALERARTLPLSPGGVLTLFHVVPLEAKPGARAEKTALERLEQMPPRFGWGRRVRPDRGRARQPLRADRRPRRRRPGRPDRPAPVRPVRHHFRVELTDRSKNRTDSEKLRNCSGSPRRLHIHDVEGEWTGRRADVPLPSCRCPSPRAVRSVAWSGSAGPLGRRSAKRG